MKRALVTGGSGDIGSCIAKRLAADGYYVYIHAHRGVAKGHALAEEIKGGGGHASVLTFDVTDASDTAQALQAVLAEDLIQVLVNNAGIHDDAVFPGMTRKQWQSVINVSLHGFFNVTQPLLMPMIRSRWGRIVNISSLSAITGNRGQVNYSAAKGAINSATRALALEVASRGITVNSIAPGIIATQSTNSTFSSEIIRQLVPMRRAGRPEEVADLAGFLCSEQAAYITGQIISINGGIPC